MPPSETPVTPQTGKPEPALVPVLDGTRLASLVTDYIATKPEYDKLDKHLTEIKDAIKAEARLAVPNQWAIDLWVSGLTRPLKIRGGERRHFDGARFQRENPVLYVQYLEWRERWEVSW